MKNIFKKLHIGGGGNHDPSTTNSTNSNTNPNRSNETSNTGGITGTHRSNETSNTSINNTNNTSITSTGTTGASLPSTISSGSDHHHNQDYYTSEEEYQVQLALALSVSGRDSSDIPQIHAPTSQFICDSPADSLSRQYWVGYCCFLFRFREYICILMLFSCMICSIG